MQQKVFILHEIYGVNDFIKDQIIEFKDEYTEIESISIYHEGKVFPIRTKKKLTHISLKKSALIHL